MTHTIYTQGPWHVVEYAGFYILQDGANYEDRDLLNIEHCKDAAANAQLAHAAPDLLHALQVLTGEIEHFPKPYSKAEKLAMARAAIEKAIGK